MQNHGVRGTVLFCLLKGTALPPATSKGSGSAVESAHVPGQCSGRVCGVTERISYLLATCRLLPPLPLTCLRSQTEGCTGTGPYEQMTSTYFWSPWSERLTLKVNPFSCLSPYEILGNFFRSEAKFSPCSSLPGRCWLQRTMPLHPWLLTQELPESNHPLFPSSVLCLCWLDHASITNQLPKI